MAIMYAIIFVVIWSVAFYLFKAYTLNSRIENIMVSMQEDVSRNNYLTPEAYTMYERMLMDLQMDMNVGGDVFINGFDINYSHDCTVDVPINGLTYSKRLDTVADMGDVAIIELTVGFRAVAWIYDASENGAANQSQLRQKENTITYVYQVPCLRYISITD